MTTLGYDPNFVELGQSWKSIDLQQVFTFWVVSPNELDTRNTVIRFSTDVRIEQKTAETMISMLKTAKLKKHKFSDSFEKYGICVRTQAHTDLMV